jgi:hypothetical protein
VVSQDSLLLNVGPIGCPETSVRNYHYFLRNSPEREQFSNIEVNKCGVYSWKGTAVAQWLRYWATNQKVTGLIPDGVTDFFIDINPSDRTMALGVDSVSDRNENQKYFLGVNAAGA